MIIAVDVRPEVEAEPARQAGLRGRPVEAYAATSPPVSPRDLEL